MSEPSTREQISDAIAAYDQALSREPEMADALYNRQLLEELLKQQQEHIVTDKKKE